MIAKRGWIVTGPAVATGKLVGAVLGHRLTLQLDDAIVTAELRRRGFWSRVEDEVRLGRSWILADPTEHGLDVFMWLGKAGDAGLALFHLEGVTPACPASMQLLALLRGMIERIDREEYFEKVGPQAGAGPEC